MAKDPAELTHEESARLIHRLGEMEPGLLILTGGDPTMRRDLLELIRRASSSGLRTVMSPSATPRLARMDFERFRESGLARLSLSLDGATRETHDAFRGVPGTWDWSMEIVSKCRTAGVPFQINTTFTRENLGELKAFCVLMETLMPVVWSVFLVVPTGRATRDSVPTAEETESLLQSLWAYSLSAPFEIKTTEAPQYRRVVLQRSGSPEALLRRAPLGINDGRGFMFISSTGDICPSGFFPLRAGNVRVDDPLEVYREHPLFVGLRDPSRLRGKCGRCEYNRVCGGSRARAYALTGDPYGEDSSCPYVPADDRATPAHTSL